jgi:hypothetical protein
MQRSIVSIAVATAVMLAAVVLGAASPAAGRTLARSAARDRAVRPQLRTVAFEASARTILASSAAAAVVDAGCAADVPVCCYQPCIRYRYRGCDRCCGCDCPPPVKVVLKVKDPCCCCYVPVPVCVPACCKGEPCVQARCGLFGRGIVEYTWDCGTCVTVVIDRRGDVRVTVTG